MGFELYRPEKTKLSSSISKDLVRVAFRGDKVKSIHIHIGLDVAAKVGIKGGDRVDFYTDGDNPRLWLLKKSSRQEIGYKTTKVSNSLKISFKWNKFKPTEDDPQLRMFKHDIHDGGIRIFGN